MCDLVPLKKFIGAFMEVYDFLPILFACLFLFFIRYTPLICSKETDTVYRQGIP